MHIKNFFVVFGVQNTLLFNRATKSSKWFAGSMDVAKLDIDILQMVLLTAIQIGLLVVKKAAR